jgi:hypothetical protein
MSDDDGHLPECPWADNSGECHYYGGWEEQVWEYHRDQGDTGTCTRCEATCLCERLRATEQRVRKSLIGDTTPEEFIRRVIVKNFDAGYVAALAKSREAVVAAYEGNWDDERDEIYRDADPNISLRVIDALAAEVS